MIQLKYQFKIISRAKFLLRDQIMPKLQHSRNLGPLCAMFSVANICHVIKEFWCTCLNALFLFIFLFITTVINFSERCHTIFPLGIGTQTFQAVTVFFEKSIQTFPGNLSHLPLVRIGKGGLYNLMENSKPRNWDVCTHKRERRT